MTGEETPPIPRALTSTMPIRSKTPPPKLDKHPEDKLPPPDIAMGSAQAPQEATSLQKTTDKKRKLPADADASLKPTAVTGRALSIRTRKKVKLSGPYETLDDGQIRNTKDYVSVYASRSFNLNKFGRSAGYFVIEKQTNEMFWVDTERNKPKQAVILSSKSPIRIQRISGTISGNYMLMSNMSTFLASSREVLFLIPLEDRQRFRPYGGTYGAANSQVIAAFEESLTQLCDKRWPGHNPFEDFQEDDSKGGEKREGSVQ